MINILHTADWHMDAPLRGFSPGQRRQLRAAQLALPGKIAQLCLREGCDLCLIAGDVFDGPYTREGYEAVYRGLQAMGVPVFIAPGNHDPYRPDSPWAREVWPENVHIFTKPELTSFRIPELDCRVYGAAFVGAESPALLPGFQAGGSERYALLVAHGDPTAPGSPYNPVTAADIRDAGVDYAALGHIHASGSFSAGGALCAWPGCPMGRGWDETGVKGVLLARPGAGEPLRFLPLDTPRFFDLTVPAGDDPRRALADALPGGGSGDFFRIRLTGETRQPLGSMAEAFPEYPNLWILDETVPAGDPWARTGGDGFPGAYFRLLQGHARSGDPETAAAAELAAKLSRRILEEREVTLP